MPVQLAETSKRQTSFTVVANIAGWIESSTRNSTFRTIEPGKRISCEHFLVRRNYRRFFEFFDLRYPPPPRSLQSPETRARPEKMREWFFRQPSSNVTYTHRQDVNPIPCLRQANPRNPCCSHPRNAIFQLLFPRNIRDSSVLEKENIHSINV